MKSYMPKGTQSGDYLSTEPGQDPESSDLTSGPAPAVSRHVLMWLVTLPSTQLVSSWALPGVINAALQAHPQHSIAALQLPPAPGTWGPECNELRTVVGRPGRCSHLPLMTKASASSRI